jgi:site-specific DNA-cytosine methylase
MKILQLCCFTNLWGPDHFVESIDLKQNRNLFNYPRDYGKNFDLVVAAPPCTQFTKANSHNWKSYPASSIKLAQLCFHICRSTAGFWFLENPPGRIERFLPELTKYRVLTWSGQITNKEYVLYSNFLIFKTMVNRYGKQNITRSKLKREKWQPDFIQTIKSNLSL